MPPLLAQPAGPCVAEQEPSRARRVFMLWHSHLRYGKGACRSWIA